MHFLLETVCCIYCIHTSDLPHKFLYESVSVVYRYTTCHIFHTCMAWFPYEHLNVSDRLTSDQTLLNSPQFHTCIFRHSCHHEIYEYGSSGSFCVKKTFRTWDMEVVLDAPSADEVLDFLRHRRKRYKSCILCNLDHVTFGDGLEKIFWWTFCHSYYSNETLQTFQAEQDVNHRVCLLTRPLHHNL